MSVIPNNTHVCKCVVEHDTKKANTLPSNSERNKVSNLIDQLLCAAQPEKCAFNNHLRKCFESINKEPLSTACFPKLKSFFCVTCNMVFHDQVGWMEHKKSHKIKHHSIFYCAICQIFYINTSNCQNKTSSDIDEHLQSVEHGVMFEFNKYIVETNAIVPIKNNSSNLTDNKRKAAKRIKEIYYERTIDKNVNLKLDDNNQEVNVVCKQEQNTKYKRNKNVYIEIEGVSDDFKKNNFCSLKQFVKKKYGEFDQISNQSKSFIIRFQNKEQVKTLIDDKTKLEETNKFKIHVIGQNYEKLLAPKTTDMLSCWPLLCTKIYNKLKDTELTLHSLEVHSKVKKLYDSVCSLNFVSDLIDVHVFGSRLYGLATEMSDVDVYLEIDGTFDGKIANDNDRQVSLVKKFAGQCRLNSNVFGNIEEVRDARVPIVKFYHLPTQLNCDVSFKSGLSLFNSKLVRLYLSMNKTVKWLACMIVKIWAPQNNLKSKDTFTSYALVWLVLFYLMTKKVIPSMAEIIENVTVHECRIIEGWDCMLAEWPNVHITCTRPKLLLEFFQYYADMENLENRVLCTFTGMSIIKKNFFCEFSNSFKMMDTQRSKFKSLKQKVCLNFEKHNGLAVQDPFELSFNLTKKITDSNLVNFCELCDQSAAILANTIFSNF